MMTTTKPSRIEVARAYAVLKAAKTKNVMIAKRGGGDHGAKALKKRKLDKKYELLCDEEPTTPGYYCPSSPCYVPSMPCYCP